LNLFSFYVMIVIKKKLRFTKRLRSDRTANHRERTMKEMRLPAYPLMTIDPLFSIWSMSQKLYEGETRMWTGAAKPINGNINIDGEVKRFMGLKGAKEVFPQKKVETGLMSTRYLFEDKKIRLELTFTSPAFLNNLGLASRPVAYVDFEVTSMDGQMHNVQILTDFSERLTYEGSKKLTKGGVLPFPEGKIGYVGRFFQKNLSEAGDYKEIDWGWLYLGGKSRIMISAASAARRYCKEDCIAEAKNPRKVLISEKEAEVSPDSPLSYFIAVGYDDNYALNYFGEFKRGYWKTAYSDIVNAIKESVADHQEVMAACAAEEERFEKETTALYGEAYTQILIAAYRQTLAAHKLIMDKDNPIMISKECGSNGCAGTVDVAYPSAPLFLFKNPLLVKAMLVPVFKFARMHVWRYSFAPHDVGIYPFVMGQVYGAPATYVIKNRFNYTKRYIFNYYTRHLYKLESQMPVEECGNMLIMSAAYFNESGDFKFIRENADLLSKWADYLVKQGIELENQLSTDDFGGHLPHNVNLAIKSIIAIALWGKMLEFVQPGGGKQYMDTAKSYAKELELRTDVGDHTTLVIEDRESWSLKYNLVWDKIFKLGLFSAELYQQETAFYKKHLNKYGVPLDSRRTYTKSDWLIWAATLDDTGEAVKTYSKAIADMLKETPSAVPFTDWYDTISGECMGFRHRSVQGALWLPLYAEHVKSGKSSNFLID